MEEKDKEEVEQYIAATESERKKTLKKWEKEGKKTSIIGILLRVLIFIIIGAVRYSPFVTVEREIGHMYFSSVEYFDKEDASITVIQRGFFDRYSVQTFYLDFEDKDRNGKLDYAERESARVSEISERYEVAGEYFDGKLTIMLTTTEEMWEEAEGKRERGFFTMGLGFKSYGKYYKTGDKIKWKRFDFKSQYKR